MRKLQKTVSDIGTFKSSGENSNPLIRMILRIARIEFQPLSTGPGPCHWRISVIERLTGPPTMPEPGTVRVPYVDTCVQKNVVRPMAERTTSAG